MTYKYYYKTPDAFSDMVMNSDGQHLTGLWFIDSKDQYKHTTDCDKKLLPVFEDTIKWLDLYYGGKIPDFTPAYKVNHLTDFRKEVIRHMLEIEYGKTRTYGDIAKSIAEKRNLKKMSAQAVGGAVGWNPICLIIPCHRVMGINGKITGYGGGITNKIALLELEKSTLQKRKS